MHWQYFLIAFISFGVCRGQDITIGMNTSNPAIVVMYFFFLNEVHLPFCRVISMSLGHLVAFFNILNF